MGISQATHQASATAVKNLGAYITLHTGAGGGANGSNEAAVTRKQTTWNAGAWNVGLDRFIFTGTEVNIPCPAGTYSEGGIFSAATGGTFVGSAAFAGGSVLVSGSSGSIDVTPTIRG